MKYCPNCAYKLAGTEKFCPECSYRLTPSQERAINIGNTSGDVGTGSTGSGNIIGKEVDYTINRNTIHIHIGDNPSKEVLETLQRMIAISTQVEQTSTTSREDLKTKLEESSTVQQQIKNVLEDVNKIEQNTGTEIKEIKAGDLQISKTELSLKEIILKGNEYYYRKEYEEAIRWYNAVLKIEPNNAGILFNKCLALANLGKYDEGTQCFNRAKQLGYR